MKLVRIGDVCKLMTGGTPSRGHPEYFENGTIKWLVSGDINQGEIFDCDGRITEEAMKSSNTKILPMNSVMIALNGQGKTRGTVALLRTSATCNQSLVCISPINKNELLSEFLFHNLRMRYQELRRMTGDDGNDRRGLNMVLIRDIEIPLPSLEKQREIVEKLDSVFAQIDSLKENLSDQQSAVSEITSGKLDQIFSRKSELDKEIRQVRLSEIARVINGRAYSQPELLKQGPYPVLRVGNFFSNRSWYYSDLELEKDKYCDNGDLLYAWSASFGPRVWDGGKVIYHYHIWKIEEKKELVLRDWLYWWFLWDVKQIKEAHGTGSTMMHVTKGAMENRLVQLPSLKVQSQQVQEIAELQLATQKLESNYKAFAENWSELKNVVLASAFENAVA